MVAVAGDVVVGEASGRSRRILVDVLVASQLSAFIVGLYLIVNAAGRGAGVVGDRPSVWLAAIAAAGVAITFERVRTGARFVANRIVFGTRAAPLEALAELSDSLTSSPDDELMVRLAEIVVRATGSTAAVIRVFDGEQMRDVATFPPSEVRDPHGTAIPQRLRVGIEDAGELLGEIIVSPRENRALLASHATLVRDLAALAATAFRSLRLRAELQARVDELESFSAELRQSRHRIVQAQHEERRRLERDIHDGGQQHLSALGIKLTHAKLVATKRPRQLRRTVLELEDLAVGALSALDDLVGQLRPESLTRDGVLAALRELATRYPFPVEIRGTAERYPDAVESTVYFACAEALQNAGKHAQPGRVLLSIARRRRHVVFVVDDDGVGFDASSAARSVTRAMSDRVAALGGGVEVVSEPGKGTRVSGRLPLRTSDGVEER